MASTALNPEWLLTARLRYILIYKQYFLEENISKKKSQHQELYNPVPSVLRPCTVLQGGALSVQMDFTRTFQTNAKCNNMNHV